MSDQHPDSGSDAPRITPRLIGQQKWLSLLAGREDEPFVSSSPGVYVVPLNYANEVMFTLEPRNSDGEYVLSLPGGAVEEAERAAFAAQREMQEEIGFKASKLDYLGRIHPLARHADWHIDLFVAQGLMPSRRVGDESYKIEIVRAHIGAFESLITEGRLTDANVISALYLARGFMNGQYQSPGRRPADENPPESTSDA